MNTKPQIAINLKHTYCQWVLKICVNVVSSLCPSVNAFWSIRIRLSRNNRLEKFDTILLKLFFFCFWHLGLVTLIFDGTHLVLDNSDRWQFICGTMKVWKHCLKTYKNYFYNYSLNCKCVCRVGLDVNSVFIRDGGQLWVMNHNPGSCVHQNYCCFKIKTNYLLKRA